MAETPITQSDLSEALADAGKAFGYAFSAGAGAGSKEALLALAETFYQLNQTERFSPNCAIVLGGFQVGIEAFLNSDPDPDAEGEIL